MYELLMQMAGEECHTLTFDNPAVMHVNQSQVTITYSTGNILVISREMVEEAINRLQRNRVLTVEDVHAGITNFSGAKTDRLMAVLRKLPGVTYDKRPRVLYYNQTR